MFVIWTYVIYKPHLLFDLLFFAVTLDEIIRVLVLVFSLPSLLLLNLIPVWPF